MAKPQAGQSGRGKRLASCGAEVKGVSRKSKRAFKKVGKRRPRAVGGRSGPAGKKKALTKARKSAGREGEGGGGGGRVEGDKLSSEAKESLAKKPHGRPKTAPGKGKKAQKEPAHTTKERRQFRREQKENYTLIAKAKAMWEQLRRHSLKPAERSVLLEQLVACIQGHVHELSLKHDTARVIQCCLKFGSPEQRTIVFTELKDHILELAKVTYSKFIVKALLKYCAPEQRSSIATSLYGHVRRLVRHAHAAQVLEAVYNDYANAGQRAALVQEFYGTQFALFKSGTEESLAAILAGHPDEREAILRHMKEALLPLAGKSVIKHSIVHRALLEFLQHCDETARVELVEALREVVVQILHTKEGSRVGMLCLWHGTPKDRKVIVKSFKSYVMKICQEEHGHLVLLSAFDCVDDTVLVRKVIISEMMASIRTLSDSAQGRKVLLYLLAPRCHAHFPPQYLDLLTPGDGNKYTKKAASQRQAELLEAVSGPLLVLAGERAGEWARDKPHAPFLLQIAASAKGDSAPLYRSVVEDLLSPFPPPSPPPSTPHLVTDPCGHWVLRRLLSTEREGDTPFAEMLLDRLSADQIRSWVTTNRGSFVVLSLLQSGGEGVRGWVGEALAPVDAALAAGKFKGQEALHAELHKT